MISYMMMIAVMFTYVGSLTTGYIKDKEICKLVKAHENELYKVRLTWHKLGWQDAISYQKSKKDSIEV